MIDASRTMLSAFAATIGIASMLSASIHAMTGEGLVRSQGTYGFTRSVMPGDTFTLVAASAISGHAVRSDGTLVSWGRVGESWVAPPADLESITDLAAGGGDSEPFVAAVLKDGSAAVWGRCDMVQGICDVPEAAQSGVVEIHAGMAHIAALKTDGSVVCWGSNTLGQLNVPEDLSPVVDLEVGPGGYHTVALCDDGSVRCWGSNGSGQCNVPDDLGAIIDVAAGGRHSLALGADGNHLEILLPLCNP